MDTTDYKQIAFKLQSDIEQLKWEQAQKDITFLKEMKERLEKWRDNNDWSERDMVFDMIEHWIDELEELNE
jgi:predicted DNA-binding protein